MGVGAAVLGVVSVGSSLAGYRNQRKANKEANRANRYQQNIARTEHARNIRMNAARARVAGAQARAAAVARGGGGGSAVQSATGSIASSSAASINFANTVQGLQESRFGALQSQMSYMNKAQGWSALGSAVSSIGFGDSDPLSAAGQSARNWWDNRRGG